MNAKNKICFDELDVKCITELPILIDVLSATMNKLSRVFNPLFNDLSETINLNMPNGWQIKTYQNNFYPFTSEEYGREKIISLDNHFQLSNSFEIIKKNGTKWKNYFYIDFGFYYSDGDEDNIPYFYFFVNKPATTEKYEGFFNPLKFYHEIQKKLEKYKIEIEHPDSGGSQEFIEIRLLDINVDKVETAYESFKNEVVLPFLKTVK